MLSTVTCAVIPGVLIYVASWSVIRNVKAKGLSLLPGVAVAGACVLATSIFISKGAPSAFAFEAPLRSLGDYLCLGGLDFVEIGTLAALVLGSLPFFAITQTRPNSVTGGAGVAVAGTLAAGLVFITTEALWLMFLSFEFLLLSAIYIILLTSKSERARDAALEMLI